jgi:cytoskeletal protein RodZ
MDTGTTILSNVSTISKKIMNITPKSSTKISKKMKLPKNNSAVLKKPSSKKNSSSRSALFILLLIFFILCIIGSILFFIFRFRQNRQGNDQSLLDRVGSEESYNSDMNESEMSTDVKPENRKGGRMLSQLDPDAL